MRRPVFLLVLMLCTSGAAFAQAERARTGPVFSVGIDLVSLGYGQFLVYLEKPVSETVSLDLALGYSPGGLWDSSFSYWYLQTDLRAYLSSRDQSGLYSQFGTAVYFADRRLDFTKWKVKTDYDTSVVFGALGGVGYKHYFTSEGGAYVDANAFLYALAPEPIVATASEERAVFQYSPFNLLGSVIAGYSF